MTYRAKSSTVVISPHPLRRGYDRPSSYSITSSQASVRSAMLVEQESISESCSSETTTPIYSPSSSKRNLKDQAVSNSGESGYSTGSSCLEGIHM